MATKLCIMLLTYNRAEYARETLLSTLENLEHDGDLYVHVADDGSPGDHYIDDLVAIALDYGITQDRITTSNSQHQGYGANYNAATQVVHMVVGDTGLVLPLEDDWRLERKLDTGPLIRLLEVAPDIGCVRLGYLGCTQELWARYDAPGGVPIWRFNPDTPEPHVFAGHPRLERVSWERGVGPWSEGLDPGSTEFEVAHRPAARRGVVWPGFVAPWGDLFSHIGTVRSY